MTQKEAEPDQCAGLKPRHGERLISRQVALAFRQQFGVQVEAGLFPAVVGNKAVSQESPGVCDVSPGTRVSRICEKRTWLCVSEAEGAVALGTLALGRGPQITCQLRRPMSQQANNAES